MITKLQQNYNGADLNAATSGIIFFLIEENCTIKKISIKTKSNATADLTFNVNLDGADLFSGSDRPKILSGSKLGQLTGLDIEANEFDELILNLEAIAGGVADSPITIIVEVDDGLSSGGGGGSEFNKINWGTKTNCTETDGVLQNNNVTEGWGTSGAFGTEYIADTGILRYIAGFTSLNKAKMLGLSFVDTNADFTSINYAMNLSGDVSVYELGTYANASTTIAFGDVFEWRVYRNDKNERCIAYYRNGTPFRIAVNIPNGNLYPDLAFFGSEAQIGKPQIKIGF